VVGVQPITHFNGQRAGIIAKDEDENPEAIRQKIRRGKKEVGQVGPDTLSEAINTWPMCRECKRCKVKLGNNGNPESG
jgi:hypothetical protein